MYCEECYRLRACCASAAKERQTRPPPRMKCHNSSSQHPSQFPEVHPTPSPERLRRLLATCHQRPHVRNPSSPLCSQTRTPPAHGNRPSNVAQLSCRGTSPPVSVLYTLSHDIAPGVFHNAVQIYYSWRVETRELGDALEGVRSGWHEA